MRLVLRVALAVTAGLACALLPSAAFAQPRDCDDPSPPPICSEDQPESHNPTGALTGAVRVPGGIRVTGHAEDVDSGPVTVDVTIAGAVVGILVANQAYPPQPGLGAVGFDGVVPARPGSAVCAIGRSTGGGNDTPIGCVNLAIRFAPTGSLDNVTRAGTTVSVGGWALDPDTADPVQVDVYHDERKVATLTASEPRSDVASAYPGYGANHGYTATLPALPGEHTVCATPRPVPGNGGPETTPAPSCRTYSMPHEPYGSLDMAKRVGRTVEVRGTATDPDDPSAPVSVHVYIDSSMVANASTIDHVFTATVAAQGGPGVHNLCAYAINIGPGSHNPQLGCLSFTVPGQIAKPVLTIPQVTSNSILASWTSSDINVTGFRVELNDGVSWRPLATLPVSLRSYTITGLSPEKGYCVNLVAIGDFSEAQADTCLMTAGEKPTVTRFSVDSPTPEVCVPVKHKLSFVVEHAVRVQITAWDRRVIHEVGAATPGTLSGQIETDENDGKVWYLLQAFNASGESTDRMVTVDRLNQPQWIVTTAWVKPITAAAYDIYFYTPEGVRGRYVGRATAPDLMKVDVPPCEFVRLGAVDVATGQLVYLGDLWLGHPRGWQYLGIEV